MLGCDGYAGNKKTGPLVLLTKPIAHASERLCAKTRLTGPIVPVMMSVNSFQKLQLARHSHPLS
jgi:hypothetical protein